MKIVNWLLRNSWWLSIAISVLSALINAYTIGLNQGLAACR